MINNNRIRIPLNEKNVNIRVKMSDPIYMIEDNVYRPNGIHVHFCGNPFMLHLFNIISTNNVVTSVNFI